MGLVPRPIKATGTDSYQGEVANGKLDIIDAELDDDIGKLYTLVNGGLSDANVATGAAIAYSKLALGGQILWTDISQSSWANRIKNVHVATDAAIDASKINFAGAPTGIIISNVSQIAPGQSVRAHAEDIHDSDTPTLLTATQTALCQITWTATSASFWRVIADLNGTVNLGGDSSGADIIAELRWFPPGGGFAVIRRSFQRIVIQAQAGTNLVVTVPWTVSLSKLGGLNASGGALIQLVAWTNVSDPPVSVSVNARSLTLLEHA